MVGHVNDLASREEQLEAMDTFVGEAYRLIAELLSYPEDLNLSEIEHQTDEIARKMVDRMTDGTADLIRSFVQDLKSVTPGEYIETLELAPQCPLYLGYWAFRNEGADSAPRRKFTG